MNGEQPQKKGTNVWLWVGCGCALLVAGAVSVVLFIVFVVFAAIRSADPYRDGIARAQADPRVREALGAPIEAGWMVSGSIQTENRSGDCDISIPLNGSKQSGVLRVVGTKDGGRWTYTKMLVTPSAGPAIDLLNAGRASAAARAKCRMGFSPSMGLARHSPDSVAARAGGLKPRPTSGALLASARTTAPAA
ncbi:MAG TPA: cytochrome c oxidase assembly factor Coa1 family protein [Thermoanaerobaculia bacterium]